MITGVELRSNGLEMAGFIPGMLNENDPRPAREQLHSNYAHGGGWTKFEGFVLDEKTWAIQYPDDPPLKPVFGILFRDENILIYPHAWVLIMQKDSTWEIARMD